MLACALQGRSTNRTRNDRRLEKVASQTGLLAGVGEVSESEGVAPQGFQAAVDGFSEAVGRVVVEVGEHVGAAAPQGESELPTAPGFFTPFVERFGFFDSIADNAIGADRSSYYRATFHWRACLLKTWSKHFERLDIIVTGHYFSRDYAVLRRPPN